MIVFTGILFLLPIVLVAGVGVAVARAVRGNDDVDWGQVVWEFFQHLVAFGLALVAAAGVGRLLALALAGPGLLRLDEALARPVTFTILGVPLFAGAIWLTVRRLHLHPEARESLAWVVHQGLVEVIALVVTMVATWELAQVALGESASWAPPAARLVVWLLVWVGYRLLAARFLVRRWTNLHVLLGSAIGLGTLATGLVQVFRTALELAWPGRTLVVDTGGFDDLVVVAIGAIVWVAYWLLDAARRQRDGWWHAWVLLGPVLNGLIAMVGSTGFVIFTVAVWLVGDPGTGLTDHFQDVPAAIATAMVATAVWALHRSLLAPRRHRVRSEVDRIHDLVLAGVGLVAAAGGLGTILVAIIEAVVGPGTVQVGTDPVNTLLAAVTFVGIGGPMWWRSWRRMQRLARVPQRGADGAVVDPTDPGRAERHSPSRRVYLFALFGIGGLVVVVTTLVGVVGVLEDLFSGALGAQTVFDVRFAVATIATIGAVAALHWSAYRGDRDLMSTEPDVQRAFPARVTLVGVADATIAEVLGDETGARVELWRRGDTITPPWDAARLVGELAGHVGAHVLVVADGAGVSVMPVDH